jgi:hypothetical protein
LVPDIVVVMINAPSSRMPANPLQVLTNLEVNAHQVSPAAVGADRLVGSTGMKAVVIEESTSTGSGPVGQSLDWGSPNQGLGRAFVFTRRAELVVQNACGNKNCLEVFTGASGPQAIADVYIGHIIAHEVFHNMRGVPLDPDRNGIIDAQEQTYIDLEHHYPSPSKADQNVVMNPAVTYKKGGTIKFYISPDFTLPDQLRAQEIYEP